jgi:hypothetical protein
MAKWSIRDLWGKRTENKGLNPGMRNMLTSLEGVYDPKAPGERADENGEQDAAPAEPAR